MFEVTFYPIIIIIILILLILFIQNSKNSIYNELVSGFYIGDNQFCEESGIDMFYLFIDNNVNNNLRNGYILMKSGDNLILNEPVSIRLSMHWHFWAAADTPKYYDIEFVDLDDELLDFFPKCQSMRFYPTSGKVVLYSDDVIFGVFYKSGFESEMKNIIDEEKYDSDNDNESNDGSDYE
jgi:hypothetical protein